MKDLGISGRYEIPAAMKQSLDEQFFADYCDDTETAATIADGWTKYNYRCDPHTAVAWNVAEKYIAKSGDARKTVVLSTASPFKFPASVAASIGLNTSDEEFEIMSELSKKSGVDNPAGLKTLKEKQVRHTEVCEKNNMHEFVLGKVLGD